MEARPAAAATAGGDAGGGRAREAEQLRVPPPHMQQVTSLTSMAGLSESSQSDLEVKSPLSESPQPLGTMLMMDAGGISSGGESEDDIPTALCSSSLKDIVTDLTFLSHEAVVGVDYPVRVTVQDHAQDRVVEAAAAEVEEKCVPTYDKWKRLSGPLALFIILGLIILIWGRGHVLQLLRWLEGLPLHLSMLVFILLFTLVSFPFGFGYIIFNMMAGYLYGILRGQLIVMVSVAVGITLSFQLCRRWFKDYARSMVTSNALRAVLRVVEGPHGFKVIFLTRFTPIPFGLQNALFAMTTISHWRFFFASVFGLLPIQILNTYMGSTVRNMQEVLADRVDGYIILGVQVVISIGLMVYLLTKARRELARLTKSSGSVQSA